MITAMLAALLRVIRDERSSPSALLVELESCLMASLRPGLFVTVFYGILDPSSGSLTYASAAHCPLLLYRAATGGVEWRRPSGIPLGARPGGDLARSLEDFTVHLQPGDLALQFTDGLNEAWNAARGEQYGYERIAKTVVRTASSGYEAVQNALCEDASRWAAPDQLDDDLTLLTLAETGTVAARPPARESTASTEAHWLTPEEQLSEMLGDVPRLTLSADLAELERLRPWLESCPGIGTLSSEQKMTIESGLFELCANIVEHGYNFATDQHFDIWWVPTGNDGVPAETDGTTTPVTTAATGVGYFVIRDQGQAYIEGSWRPPDLSDPALRRRSRGLGLHIVHSTANKVVLVGNTPAGNLTMLHFDPPRASRKEKVPHG